MLISLKNIKNPPILTQSESDDMLTLSIDGEHHEIKNLLSELKSLLQKHQTQTVQYADKIYNIAHINEANFGFFTGKRAFNELLTRSLIESIQQENKAAKRFIEVLKSKNLWETAWEEDDSISSNAKKIINYSFVGVLGIQLSKLMAIGKEPFSENKQRKYIQKCIHIAKWSLDLLCFALISKLWDIQKEETHTLKEEHQKTIHNFFEGSFELSMEERGHLLKTLLQIFAENNFPLPLLELIGFEEELHENAPFYLCCQSFQALNTQLDKQYSLLDCFEAEKQLAFLLDKLRFWVKYRMASVKLIIYQEQRFAAPKYLHRYAALGIDSKAQVDAEKVDYTPATAQTESILLYKGDNYAESINLFPFVIDYNALTFESGAKICFYRCKDLINSYLEYIFLEDNSSIYLEKENIRQSNLSINDIMIDQENRKRLNLDNVTVLFHDAQTTITGDIFND